MARHVEFHPEAAAEFDAALDYYRAARGGLAERFLAAVRASTDVAIASPDAGHALPGSVRRLLIRGFPYAVLYAAESERIYILAVAHTRRRPGYWRPRAG